MDVLHVCTLASAGRHAGGAGLPALVPPSPRTRHRPPPTHPPTRRRLLLWSLQLQPLPPPACRCHQVLRQRPKVIKVLTQRQGCAPCRCGQPVGQRVGLASHLQVGGWASAWAGWEAMLGDCPPPQRTHTHTTRAHTHLRPSQQELKLGLRQLPPLPQHHRAQLHCRQQLVALKQALAHILEEHKGGSVHQQAHALRQLHLTQPPGLGDLVCVGWWKGWGVGWGWGAARVGLATSPLPTATARPPPLPALRARSRSPGSRPCPPGSGPCRAAGWPQSGPSSSGRLGPGRGESPPKSRAARRARQRVGTPRAPWRWMPRSPALTHMHTHSWSASKAGRGQAGRQAGEHPANHSPHPRPPTLACTTRAAISVAVRLVSSRFSIRGRSSRMSPWCERAGGGGGCAREGHRVVVTLA